MLSTACFVITAETPFPGIVAVLPVVGTAMLILSGAAVDAPGRRTVSSEVLSVAADADHRRLVVLALPLALAGLHPARRSPSTGR